MYLRASHLPQSPCPKQAGCAVKRTCLDVWAESDNAWQSNLCAARFACSTHVFKRFWNPARFNGLVTVLLWLCQHLRKQLKKTRLRYDAESKAILSRGRISLLLLTAAKHACFQPTVQQSDAELSGPHCTECQVFPPLPAFPAGSRNDLLVVVLGPKLAQPTLQYLSNAHPIHFLGNLDHLYTFQKTQHKYL